MKFYQLDIKTLEKELNTDIVNGISDTQASERIKECGYNIQRSDVFSNTFSLDFNKSLLLVVLSALIYVVMSIFMKDYTYVYYAVALVIIAMLNYFVITAYGTYLNKAVYSSYRNDYALLSCVRNGESIKLPACEIMYGDVVLLDKGDFIPFDARVIESSDFFCR